MLKWCYIIKRHPGLFLRYICSYFPYWSFNRALRLLCPGPIWPLVTKKNERLRTTCCPTLKSFCSFSGFGLWKRIAQIPLPNHWIHFRFFWTEWTRIQRLHPKLSPRDHCPFCTEIGPSLKCFSEESVFVILSGQKKVTDIVLFWKKIIHE